MVPWHPPCALISLIFSSLDPETNCCYIEDEVSGLLSLPSYLLLRIATGLHIESLFVQLSRCSGFPAFLAFGGISGFPIQCLFPNPESDTELIRTFARANIQQLPIDAVRLCQPSVSEFDSPRDFVALLYPPCWWLMDD